MDASVVIAPAALAPIDVLEKMRRLFESNSDPTVRHVLTEAGKEIIYLRGVFSAVEHGARPLKDFWETLREQDRNRWREW
jgi:hypothetical protein